MNPAPCAEVWNTGCSLITRGESLDGSGVGAYRDVDYDEASRQEGSRRSEGDGFDGPKYMKKIREDQSSIPEKRGLFIVDLLTDEVQFNPKGNVVTIVMHREDEAKA